MIYALTYLLGIVTGYLIRYYWKREKGDGVTVEFTISGDKAVEGMFPMVDVDHKKWSMSMEGLYLIEEDEEEQNEEGFDVFLN